MVRWRLLHILSLLICTLVFLGGTVAGQAVTPEFIPFDSAKPILQKMPGALPSQLKALVPQLSATQWLKWVQQSDADVRNRLVAGEEDTLSNLLRFGVTYTKEYRIDDEYLARYGESSLVNSFAENRANDLVKALASPNGNEGLLQMQSFLKKMGFSLDTPAGRKQVKQYMLNNLARMQKEFLQAKTEALKNRYEMFQNRGISLDTNLWPDYDLDESSAADGCHGHAETRQHQENSHRRPRPRFRQQTGGHGLLSAADHSALRCVGLLVSPATFESKHAVELYTLDISSLVNLHIAHAVQQAAHGRPYALQLPWYAGGRWTDEFRAKFVQCWGRPSDQGSANRLRQLLYLRP